jgi:uncharacterized protein (DUF1499 family)
MPERRSRLALVGAVLGFDAVTIGGLGVLLATLGVIAPFLGFGLFAFVGGPLAVLAVIVSAFALRATRASGGLGGRNLAWAGLAMGAAMLLVLSRSASAGAGLPRINDITTDPNDPPAFEYTLRDPATRDRDYSYPAGFADLQRAAYPDLAPIALALPPDRAFDAAMKAVEKLGLDVTLSDQARGVIEARATSKLFRFVDDVAIRIRPKDGGSVVDIRSKSRVGKGDLGANADRIRAIAAELASAS